MNGIGSYMDSYLDRRMASIVEEWQLATRFDASDLEHRISILEDDIQSISNFEKMADVTLNDLENRIARLKEAKQ